MTQANTGSADTVNDLERVVPTKNHGRPSSFTPEVADLICERLIGGESLRQICQDPKMPARSTIFRWVQEHKEFARQYRLAKKLQIDALFDEILEIAK